MLIRAAISLPFESVGSNIESQRSHWIFLAIGNLPCENNDESDENGDCKYCGPDAPIHGTAGIELCTFHGGHLRDRLTLTSHLVVVPSVAHGDASHRDAQYARNAAFEMTCTFPSMDLSAFAT